MSEIVEAPQDIEMQFFGVAVTVSVTALKQAKDPMGLLLMELDARLDDLEAAMIEWGASVIDRHTEPTDVAE